MNIFNGFWLRTLQPPGHSQCHTIILSNSQTSNADYISQHEYKPGVSGIVYMKPKESRDHSEWRKIHWIMFGFDEDSNPVIWLANYKHSKRLRNAFEQALASGNNSSERQQLMETCKNNWKMDTIEQRRSTEDYAWFSEKSLSRGPLIITVNGQKNGFRGKVIEDLELKISFHLKPFRSPISSSIANTEDSGLSQNPTRIWTVELTGADGETEEERMSRWKARAIKRGLFILLVVFAMVVTIPPVVLIKKLFFD